MLPTEIWEIVCLALPTPSAHRAFALTCRDFASIASQKVVLRAAIFAFSKKLELPGQKHGRDCVQHYAVLPRGWKHGYYSLVLNSNGVVVEDGVIHCDSIVYKWEYKATSPQPDDVYCRLDYIVDTSSMTQSVGVTNYRTIVPRLSSTLLWFRQHLNPPVWLSAHFYPTHVMVFRGGVLIYRVDLILMTACLEKHGNEYVWDDEGLLFHAVWSSGQCLSHSCPRNPSLTPFSYVFTKRMSCDDLLLE